MIIAPLAPLAPLLFGLRAPVGRRAYVSWGVGLALVKFAIDTAVVWAFTGKTWSPLGYIVPSLTLREEAVGRAPEAMVVLLPLLAMPFLWIGLTMSVRRAADAGVSPWLGTLFVVPIINYVVIVALSALPTARPSVVPAGSPPLASAYREPPPRLAIPPSAEVGDAVVAALAAIAPSVVIGVFMLGLSVYGLGMYGATLFFVTPLAMGATTAVIYNSGRARSLAATLGVVTAGVALAGSVPLLFALEGLVCLMMAAPIATVLAWIGAIVGRSITLQNRSSDSYFFVPVMLALPGIALSESWLARPAPRDVSTTIDIDAPPERVWPHVVGFAELPEPPQWFFRLGIAYPRRARIEGSGVGAVRRCEFSTGAFVEPITEWSPPSRLAFDVTSQPPSMTEWSPFREVHPPHLEGFMVSKGGEFDLTPLPGGRTRLEGTTHYTLAMYPQPYWTVYAELLLHAIHRRVLVHIKALAEAG
jgi:uncharacterized membrane protein YhaH (DUF805 family)